MDRNRILFGIKTKQEKVKSLATRLQKKIGDIADMNSDKVDHDDLRRAFLDLDYQILEFSIAINDTQDEMWEAINDGIRPEEE